MTSKSIQIGSDETFDGAETGNSGKGGLQFGSAQSRYSGDMAESAVQASLGGLPPGIHAWAEAGHKFTVEGNGSGDTDIIVKGEYDGAQVAALDADAQSTVSIKLVNLSEKTGGGLPWESPTPTEVTNTQVFHAKSYVAHWNWFGDEFEERMSTNLNADDTYYAFLKTHTEATGAFPGTSIADMHNSGNTDGFGRVDEIRIEWD